MSHEMDASKVEPPVAGNEASPKVEEAASLTPAVDEAAPPRADLPTISEEIVTKADQLATRAAAVGWHPVRMAVERFFAGANAFLDGLVGENGPKKKG